MADRSLAMSAREFRAAFPSEGEHVEFKSGISGKDLQNTAVAFSNTTGGVVLIGVADDGSVAGRALDAGTQDDIHRAMQEARDVGRYSMVELDVDGRPVVALSIARRHEGISQTSQGVPRVRRGTRDDALFGGDLVRLVNERASSRYETTTLDIGADQIDRRLRAELGSALRWRRTTLERLRELELVVDSRLTVAGALYLVRDPGRHLGKAHVELLRFRHQETIDYDRREELRGPLQRLIPVVLRRVLDQLGSEMAVLGARRYEFPLLPEVVLREAITNALAHRSYEASGAAVKIELRPRSVIVRSPGGFPEPVTVDNIRETNAARNIAVIRLLRSLGLAEDAGRGVDVMQDHMAAELLRPPRFVDRGREVVVELRMGSAATPSERAWLREMDHAGVLDGDARMVLVHAARGVELTNARVRDVLGVEAGGAREVLSGLRDAGLLEQRGERGGASYRLSRSVTPPAGLRLSPIAHDDVVRRLAADRPSITNSDVRAATGLDRAEALALLDRLVRDGTLVRSGERRGTRYAAVSRRRG